VRFAALVPPAPAEVLQLLGSDGGADAEALRAWLISVDSDATATAGGAAIGAEGFVVAVPVGQPDEGVHLVVHFGAEPPPRVRDALKRSLAGFRSLSLDPAPPTRLRPRLSAIA